jgi:hypothetical protein
VIFERCVDLSDLDVSDRSTVGGGYELGLQWAMNEMAGEDEALTSEEIYPYLHDASPVWLN